MREPALSESKGTLVSRPPLLEQLRANTSLLRFLVPDNDPHHNV